MRLPQPFIRLPWQFDPVQLAQELAPLLQQTWQAHPTGLAGNSALALISREGQANNDFTGRMTPTPQLLSSEYLLQCLSSFNEVLGRSRLMRLAAGAEVSRHVDFNYHWHSRVRIHIPIVTNPAVIFHCGNDEVHMQAGECWIFDSWRHHRVVNAGDKERVHLVIDVAGSSRFWASVRNAASQSTISEQLAYKPGFKPQLLTEQYNAAPIMAPGEMEALVEDLIDDFSACAANDSELSARYGRLLRDLCLDWRELWHLHGLNKGGWPHYQSRLEVTVKALSPKPRALITSSNALGVNPIIMQRIIRPAINRDQHQLFTE